MIVSCIKHQLFDSPGPFRFEIRFSEKKQQENRESQESVVCHTIGHSGIAQGTGASFRF